MNADAKVVLIAHFAAKVGNVIKCWRYSVALFVVMRYCIVFNFTSFMFQTLVTLNFSLINNRARDSVVGIATRYGLDGPGIESRRGGETFRISPDRPWGSPSLLYNGYWLFTRSKAAGAWR